MAEKRRGLGSMLESFGGLVGNAAKQLRTRGSKINTAVDPKKKKKKRKTRAQILSEI